jgi:hypothetical protein
MKNKKLIVLVSIFILVISSNVFVRSQSTDEIRGEKLKRFEIGGQFSILRRTDMDAPEELFRRVRGRIPSDYPVTLTELGFGARVNYNFTKNVAVEAEANFFPQDKRPNYVIGVPIRIREPGGRKFQAVFGPKIGIRKNKFGVFAKARPGFIILGRYAVVEEFGSTPQSNFAIISRKFNQTFLAADVGGVIEYYPSRRTVVRFDVGDTIIRYDAKGAANINPSVTRHNLQFSTGFGFRF